MNEKQLQSKIVIDFSHKMPELRGCLWATANRTFSIKDGQTQMAMGMIPGVSDLILFYKKRMVALEVKVIGKIHKKEHIERQLEWGKKIEANGGRYFIITSVADFWDIFNSKEVKYNIFGIEKLLKDAKSQVIF